MKENKHTKKLAEEFILLVEAQGLPLQMFSLYFFDDSIGIYIQPDVPFVSRLSEIDCSFEDQGQQCYDVSDIVRFVLAVADKFHQIEGVDF